jgi:putative ABC transport system ATP-binding protein
MADLLRVRDLRKTFESDEAPVRALRGVDLTVNLGDYVAIMGPSGSGKSTLLQVIAGLQPADGGAAVLAGESLVGRSDAELTRLRRAHIGIVFQFFNLLEDMTAIENVVLADLIGGARPADALARARQLLTMLGLAGKERALPAVLSGGQRQRLAIARALAHRPTLLLADEPTGALDSGGAAEIMELFRRLHAAGQTILMVTHDQSVADNAQRVVTMRDGRIDSPAPLEVAFAGERFEM